MIGRSPFEQIISGVKLHTKVLTLLKKRRLYRFTGLKGQCFPRLPVRRTAFIEEPKLISVSKRCEK